LGLPITRPPTAPSLPATDLGGKVLGAPPSPAAVGASDLLARALAILAEETAAWQARQGAATPAGDRT